MNLSQIQAFEPGRRGVGREARGRPWAGRRRRRKSAGSSRSGSRARRSSAPGASASAGSCSSARPERARRCSRRRSRPASTRRSSRSRARASRRPSSASTRSSSASSRAARRGSRASGAASASSSSTRSTRSACAGRRSTPASAARRGGFRPHDVHDLLWYGPYGALNPSGDLILENRSGASGSSPSARRSPDAVGAHEPRERRHQLHVPGRDGWRRLARAEPAPRRHGRDRQPAVLQEVLHEQGEHAARRDLHRPAAHREALAPASGSAPAQGADLLHRRDQRPRRPARPRAHAAGPAWAATSGSGRRRSRTGSTSSTSTWKGRARARARPGAPARGDRPRHERLLARDARAGDLDGAHDRAPLAARGARRGTTSSKQ